jgi:hypothetical protein
MVLFFSPLDIKLNTLHFTPPPPPPPPRKSSLKMVCYVNIV